MLRFATLILCILLANCSTNNKSQYDLFSEQELYDQARRLMIEQKYQLAAEAYQTLETRFPFGQYSEQSQLEIITAYYQGNDYELSIAAAERFMRLHPDHPEVDFAYYYRGLSRFDMNRGVLDKFFNLDLSKRDPSAATASFNDFAELVSRYPESQFAADATGRMQFLRNLMARHEIHVANYYFKRGAFLAAANRGKYVVEHYPGSPATSDALAVMVQAYKILEMNDLAANSLKVLKENYPKHEALDDNGNFVQNFSLEETESSRLKRSVGSMGGSSPALYDSRN